MRNEEDHQRTSDFEYVVVIDVRTIVPLYVPSHHPHKTVEAFREDIEKQLENRRKQDHE